MKRARMLPFAAAIAMLAAASPALAETTIGVANFQKIMHDSKAAAAVTQQLQAKQKTFQAELDSKGKALQEEGQALDKMRGTADREAFEKKVKSFESKRAAAAKEIDAKRGQLDKAYSGALEQIKTNVLDISKQIASEKKMSAVLDSGQLLYADPAFDVTDEVLKRLNDKLPTVKVSF